MTTLAAWSAGSMALGVAMLASKGDGTARLMGAQHLAWGAIDGGLAAFGLLSRVPAKPPTSWADERRKMRNLFLFNVALDVVYVVVGGALLAAGTRPEVRGSGAGVLVQGGFLLGFDALGALVMHGR